MNEKKSGPRILLVENDKRVRESYQELLRYWGYSPILATGEGKALTRDAIAKARKYHCILALIDLRLTDDFDEDDTSGLKLAEAIGPIRSIILSGFPNQTILLEMLDNHKDIPFLRKSDSPEKIKKALDIEVEKVCASQRGLQITPNDLLDQIALTTFGALIEDYPDQIADILAQLFPGAKNLKIEKLDSSLTYSHASTVPRPQSVVLRVYEEDYEPVVVKLARAEKIGVEVDRYEKHIARKIGGNFIAKLERYILLWDVGGALYSYIGDFDVKTFSRYYEEHSFEEIKVCLESFFTVSWGRHYERRQPYQNVSLFDLYTETWGNWYDKRVKNFSTRDFWVNEGMHKHMFLPDPIEWFKTKIAENPEMDVSRVEQTERAITHGDLHGDNLLVDSHRNAWVIDFERSGDGHALQDFVELEADIINRLEAHSEYINTYLQMGIAIAGKTSLGPLSEEEIQSQEAGMQKFLQTISLLRSLALKCTGIQDARQYVLGLLFNTLFRATINNAEKYRARQHRALMLAGIFCHRLEHWNESWPPEEWKPVLQK